MTAVVAKKTDKPWQFKPKHIPWNKGTGGCERRHDPKFYKEMPSGIFVCLACKRENAAKYRAKHREHINLQNRLGRYCISVKDFESLWDKQGGVCAICGTSLKEIKFRIDHNHNTGEVRGLLCVACNTGIGLLKDSPEVLASAERYLLNDSD